ncbi:nicotinate-nucleotide--dimethylbenzimidazole phosphoribosyltransferase [Pseudoxanthomonas beigongshangi]
MSQDWIHADCRQPSSEHRERARARQDELTKPQGSLGRIETLAVELAALQHRDRPVAARVPVIVFAGDHGVVAQGVSAFPSEVTVQMLHNFANGGAAISVLARELGLPLRVVDAGTRATHAIAGVQADKPCHGTRDFSVEAAMSEDELGRALAAGRRAIEAAEAADLFVFGEMGIGNTTAASALACALADLPLDELVGAGTGLQGDRIAHKQQVIADALALHRPHIAGSGDPARETLRRVGGLEIAAMAGAMIAAAQRGVPVLVDGFIVSAAALAAVGLQPQVRPWLLFSHQSAERGHARVLAALDARPLLQLDLRLGEGSGAALALPLLRLACALHAGMATFAEAAVSGRDDAP